jgi:hypothetical protein
MESAQEFVEESAAALLEKTATGFCTILSACTALITRTTMLGRARSFGLLSNSLRPIWLGPNRPKATLSTCSGERGFWASDGQPFHNLGKGRLADHPGATVQTLKTQCLFEALTEEGWILRAQIAAPVGI